MRSNTEFLNTKQVNTVVKLSFAAKRQMYNQCLHIFQPLDMF